MAPRAGLARSAYLATALAVSRPTRSLAGRPAAAAAARGAPNRRRNVIFFLVLMAATARLPFERRVHQRIIMIMIVLAAVAGIARDNEARIVAWDRRRNLRYRRSRTRSRRLPAGGA
jgi:hypothetical protein